MKRWTICPANTQTVRDIAQTFSLPKSLAHVLVSRGVDTQDKVGAFFDCSLSKLTSPFELPDMDRTCDWLIDAIVNQKKILVHGDFDADGITSSALFKLFFDQIEMPIQVYIPNRLDENHGISHKAIEKVKTEKIDLVMTCDCGSTSIDEIKSLIQVGAQVIITDHHHAHLALPEGALLINPQAQAGDSNLKELSGVGVVFFVLMALRKKMREQGFFEGKAEPNLKHLLDVVALGTVADMAPMGSLNRVLVSQGLRVLEDHSQVGLHALKEAVGLDPLQKLTDQDIGFKLAPKINAAARLGHAGDAFDLLTSQDPLEAKLLATKLVEFNEQRKKIQEAMLETAMPQALRQSRDGAQVLVIESKDFHVGIIGLMAQKLSKLFKRPCFVFALQDVLARGSARSPKGFHLVDIMEGVSDLLGHFGGHAQAGGCTMPVERVLTFASEVQLAFKKLYKIPPKPSQEVDAVLELEELNMVFFDKLEHLEPFGMGHAHPVFEISAEVVGKPFEVGKNHLKCKVKSRHGEVFDVIAFDKFKAWHDKLLGHQSLVVQPQKQMFRGKTQISLQLLDFA